MKGEIPMDESETQSIELDGGEARTVIHALATAKATKSGREKEEITNIQRYFQREFGFNEHRDEADTDSPSADSEEFQWFTNSQLNPSTGDSGPHSIELSMGEAETVITALSESDPNQADAESTTYNIQEQLKSTFEID
jgi:hypothetical protein